MDDYEIIYCLNGTAMSSACLVHLDLLILPNVIQLLLFGRIL